jgi:hypothetical protein
VQFTAENNQLKQRIAPLKNQLCVALNRSKLQVQNFELSSKIFAFQ